MPEISPISRAFWRRKSAGWAGGKKKYEYDMCSVEMHENTWGGDKMSGENGLKSTINRDADAISSAIGEEHTIIAITH